MGSEDWFKDVVGLQNWGIDLLKDINHIKNSDLVEVFVDKVYNKGYTYFSCRSKKLKSIIEELYRAVFQSELPKEGFLPESFARAIVSEVLHFTNINWARLAIEKWRRKGISNQAIVYMEGGENVTYQTVVLSTL